MNDREQELVELVDMIVAGNVGAMADYTQM